MANVTHPLDVLNARVWATSPPPELVQILGTGSPGYPVWGFAFDGAGATAESLYWELFASDFGASNSSITVFVDWYPTVSATGNVVFQAQLAARSPGDAASVLAQSLATVAAASAVSVSTSQIGFPKRSTITVTALNSLAADDSFTLRILRDPANAGDTYTSDVVMTIGILRYSDT